MDTLWDTDTLIRIALSALLGGAIGLEREFHGRAAGIRTHILVCLGSTVMMLVSKVSGEQARLAAGVATGIGFIGAGEIIRLQATVRGLTTAACLWLTASIGIMVGLGIYKLPALVTAVALAALLGFARLEAHIPRRRYCTIQVEAKGEPKILRGIKAVLKGRRLRVQEESITFSAPQQTVLIELTARYSREVHSDEIIAAISAVEGVIKATWK
jgi:putative Mg2+ transporter-C (MgtC) family protein